MSTNHGPFPALHHEASVAGAPDEFRPDVPRTREILRPRDHLSRAGRRDDEDAVVGRHRDPVSLGADPARHRRSRAPCATMPVGPRRCIGRRSGRAATAAPRGEAPAGRAESARSAVREGERVPQRLGRRVGVGHGRGRRRARRQCPRRPRGVDHAHVRHSVLHDPAPRPPPRSTTATSAPAAVRRTRCLWARCQRALGEVGRGDVLGRLPEELLEISHGVLPMRLRSSGAPVRSRASPAAFWLLTVPTETPSTSAVSRSVRSSKWRSTEHRALPGCQARQ